MSSLAKDVIFLGFLGIGIAIIAALLHYFIILLKKVVNDIGDIVLYTTLQTWDPLPQPSDVSYDTIKGAKKLLKQQGQWTFSLNQHAATLWRVVSWAAKLGIALVTIGGVLLALAGGLSS